MFCIISFIHLLSFFWWVAPRELPAMDEIGLPGMDENGPGAVCGFTSGPGRPLGARARACERASSLVLLQKAAADVSAALAEEEEEEEEKESAVMSVGRI